MYKQAESLVSKVTKESLEDIAAKEARNLNAALAPRVVGLLVTLVLGGVVLPSSAWWILMAVSLVAAAYFKVQFQRLEDLQGRAAGRISRTPRASSRSPSNSMWARSY